jgi:hypothetical protein
MSLTPLEIDFLGDLAADDYDLWELFEFVRLHHPEDADRGLARGRKLLASWLAMGWIEDANGSLDAQGILDSLAKLGKKGADFALQSPRLHLSRLGHAVVASADASA